MHFEGVAFKVLIGYYEFLYLLGPLFRKKLFFQPNYLLLEVHYLLFTLSIDLLQLYTLILKLILFFLDILNFYLILLEVVLDEFFRVISDLVSCDVLELSADECDELVDCSLGLFDGFVLHIDQLISFPFLFKIKGLCHLVL